MNYTIIKTDDKYVLCEMPDLLVIKSSKSERTIKKWKKMMVSGSGFEGVTPAFFVKRNYLEIQY